MFDEIQFECATRLRRHPYLASLDIITEDKGDVDTQIEQQLANLGIAITVLTVSANCESPDAEPIFFNEIGVVVEVVEFVMMNRGEGGSMKPIGKVCEAVMQALHMWTPDGADNTYTLSEKAMYPVTPPEPATAARHIEFTTTGELPVMREKPIT